MCLSFPEPSSGRILGNWVSWLVGRWWDITLLPLHLEKSQVLLYWLFFVLIVFISTCRISATESIRWKMRWCCLFHVREEKLQRWCVMLTGQGLHRKSAAKQRTKTRSSLGYVSAKLPCPHLLPSPALKFGENRISETIFGASQCRLGWEVEGKEEAGGKKGEKETV